MFAFGNPSFDWLNVAIIFIIWNAILIVGSVFYSIVAVTTGHHDPDNVHEGDEFKSLDYGLYQMAVTIERKQASANLFMSLAYFGDHMLHHLFPTLDHSILPQLREILIETCKDFNEEIRQYSMLAAVTGQFKQLSRTDTLKLV